MLNLKILRDWFVLICVLLILPPDNRLSLHTKPADWYCELRTAIGPRAVLLAKNSGTTTIEMNLHATSGSIVSVQPDGLEGVPLTANQGAPPTSIIIADVIAPELLTTSRVTMANGLPFRPGKLSILT